MYTDHKITGYLWSYLLVLWGDEVNEVNGVNQFGWTYLGITYSFLCIRFYCFLSLILVVVRVIWRNFEFQAVFRSQPLMHFQVRQQHPGGSLLDEFGWNLPSPKWCRSSSCAVISSSQVWTVIIIIIIIIITIIIYPQPRKSLQHVLWNYTSQ